MKITEGGLRRLIRQVIKESSMDMDNKSGVDQAIEILQGYDKQLDVMLREDGLGKTYEKINKLEDFSEISKDDSGEYLRSTVLLTYHGMIMRDLKIVYDKLLGQYPETVPYDPKVESLKKFFASDSPLGRKMGDIYEKVFGAKSFFSEEPGFYQDSNKRIDLNREEKRDILFVKRSVQKIIKQLQDGSLDIL